LIIAEPLTTPAMTSAFMTRKFGKKENFHFDENLLFFI
jgi:hypothetical protein